MTKFGLPYSCLHLPILVAFYQWASSPWCNRLYQKLSWFEDPSFEFIHYRKDARPIIEETECIWRWIIPVAQKEVRTTKSLVQFLVGKDVAPIQIHIIPIKIQENSAPRYIRRSFKKLGCSVGTVVEAKTMDTNENRSLDSTLSQILMRYVW